MLELINQLRRYVIGVVQLDPNDIEITVRFKNQEAQQQRAEYFLRTNIGLTTSFAQVDTIVDGRPFKIMGFNFLFKPFEYSGPRRYEYLPACGCQSCEAKRANAYAAAGHTPRG